MKLASPLIFIQHRIAAYSRTVGRIGVCCVYVLQPTGQMVPMNWLAYPKVPYTYEWGGFLITTDNSTVVPDKLTRQRNTKNDQNREKIMSVGYSVHVSCCFSSQYEK